MLRIPTHLHSHFHILILNGDPSTSDFHLFRYEKHERRNIRGGRRQGTRSDRDIYHVGGHHERITCANSATLHLGEMIGGRGG